MTKLPRMTSDTPDLPLDEPSPPIGGPDVLTVDVDGFEGPLDLLLALAKAQKVDLRRISIVDLADQYIAFVNEARALRLELAADYLVMAAWLAYLKSRLLLPESPSDDQPSGEDLAARMALQLERLEAIRAAAAKLMSRHQLGRDVFARGAPELGPVVRHSRWRCQLYDVIKAYADWTARKVGGTLTVRPPRVFTIDAALQRLSAMLGVSLDWVQLEHFLPDEFADPVGRRSALAGTFAATLELVRRGRIQLRQAEPFGPILIRKAPE